MCLDNLIVADPAAKGPYYGISGYWCWIASAYSTEKYTSEYLFMFVSAGFSFTLYSLVFLRLRGNITHSGGYRIYFQQRPKVRVGRTSTGTYITSYDRRVESDLTAMAKQMLWYPIAYTVLVLPIGATRFYTVSHGAVPFSVTIATAALLMLSGFVNTVLFCTTRGILPSGWRKKFSTGITLGDGPADVSWSSWGNATRRESVARKGPVGAGRASFVIDISVEKNIEVRYDDEASSLTSPTWPLRAYDGRQRADNYSYHIRHPSYPQLRHEGRSVCLDGEEGAGVLNDEVLPDLADEELLHRPLHAPRRREGCRSDPLVDLEAPVSAYPFSTGYSVNTKPRQGRLPPILTFSDAHISRISGDLGGNGSGVYYDDRPPQDMHMGIFHPAGDKHPYSPTHPGTESGRPAGY